MRSRGSNQLSARVNANATANANNNAKKDPDGQSSTSAAMTSSAGTSANVNANVNANANFNAKVKAQRNKFPLPGTAKPKRPLEFRPALRRNTEASSASTGGKSPSSILPLVAAVFLWYSLGVVSISSSKVLLTPYGGSGIDDVFLDDEYETHARYQHAGGVSPLFLTVQQLLLGSTFLRLAIEFKFMGLTKGLVPLEELLESLSVGKSNGKSSIYDAISSNNRNHNHNVVPRYLVGTGIFFALGFLTTNMAFGAASPTYVETLKAAEPITSAIFAVLWGIEVLTFLEVLGLVGIVGGVLLSTTGSNHSASMAEGAGSSLFVATAIVMASNLCFSLRGLYQKLFRKGAAEVATATAKATVASSQLVIDDDNDNDAISKPPPKQQQPLDDLNLQFRMQQTGVLLLLIPTVILNGPGLFRHATGAASNLSTHAFLKLIKKYALWSIGNGLAFSSYNLASTYLLTRISVVHHAALNCTRRIFAIVCTGLLFRIPVSFQSMVGITISFVGFMVFTKAKSIKNQKASRKQRIRSRKTKKQRDVENVAPNEESLPSSVSSFINGGHQEHSSTVANKTNDFGTHRRPMASASRNPTRFPIPSPPGSSNRTTAATMTAARFPPPPPPPPPPPLRGF
jgi:drug/metabolite transporter (DMT)-like permease